jgi:hypothetical protein
LEFVFERREIHGGRIPDCVGRGDHVVVGDWRHQIVYQNRVNRTQVSVRGIGIA